MTGGKVDGVGNVGNCDGVEIVEVEAYGFWLEVLLEDGMSSCMVIGLLWWVSIWWAIDWL